ncbi:MAG: hypothetical protein ACT4QA_23200 [Panacagrimonas sp.]
MRPFLAARSNFVRSTLTVILWAWGGLAWSYPILDAVVGLPHPELVTVYPDDANKSLYYFVPTSVALAVDPVTKKPKLGVQYWGLTGSDLDGAGAALTFSVRPAFDKETVDEVAKGLKKVDANASYAFPTLVDSKMEMIINGHFVPEAQDKSTPSLKGGTVDATQVFTIGLSRIGARAFANGSSPDMDVMGARYTYKFTGIAKRLHAKITIYHKRVYDHFKIRSSSTSWWGLVKSDWSADWQSLTSDGSIKLEILEGGETDTDAYMLEVFKSIVNAKINETGMFAPKLKPNGIEAGGGSSGSFGWSFSGGGGWEHLDETVNFAFNISTQKLEDREFTVGMSFNAVCAKYPDNFADLTTIGNKCIDKAKYDETAKQQAQCLTAKLATLQALLDAGKITQELWEKRQAATMKEPCLGTTFAGTGAAPTSMRAATAEDEKSNQSCLQERMAALQKDLPSDRLPAGMGEDLASHALAVPCRRKYEKQDPLVAGLRRSYVGALAAE